MVTRWRLTTTRLSALVLLLILALALTACPRRGPRATERPPAPQEALTPPPPAGATPEFAPAVAPGFRATVYASGLEEVRQVAFDSQGVPYVTVMNRGEPGTGKLLALPDHDGDGQADAVITTLAPLDRPHGLVFHEGSLYVSEPHRIQRIIDADGDLRAERTEVIIDNMPTEGDHWSRPFVFAPDGSILVLIGSSCNATCTEWDERRATVQRYAADGTPLGPVAGGLRSAVDLAYRPGTADLWTVNNGRDWMGPDEPNDTAHIIRAGHHYGWPFCHSDLVVDEEVAARDRPSPPDGLSSAEFCATQATAPDLLLPPHIAPLGLAFGTSSQFPARWRGGLFMAWHGAFDFSNMNGYRVVYIPFAEGEPGAPQSFVNWVQPDGRVTGRPVGLRFGPEGSLYVTDDAMGQLYRIDYVGSR